MDEKTTSQVTSQGLVRELSDFMTESFHVSPDWIETLASVLKEEGLDEF